MRDTYGLVPPSIRANYEREEMVDRMARAALPIMQAVKRFDHRCELKFIGPRAEPRYGLIPGRWHVVRHNDPPADDTYIPIVGEHDSYRDPDFGILDALHERDFWRPGAVERMLRPKPQESGDDGRVDELASDLRAGARLPGDKGLTGRYWGRGRPKGLVGS